MNLNLYFLLKTFFGFLNNTKNTLINFFTTFNNTESFLEHNYIFFLVNTNKNQSISFNKKLLNSWNLSFFNKNTNLLTYRSVLNFSNQKLVFSANPLILFKYHYFFNTFESLLLFLFHPIFFKYSFFSLNTKNLNKLNLFKFLVTETNDKFYYSKILPFSNNITPSDSFFYIFKKKILKIFSYSKFPSITSIWYYNTLTRFLEFCSGKKVCLRINTFLNNHLTFFEKAQCLLWAQKVKYFRKVLGPRLFLNESLQIIYLSLKLKDPFILTNWIVSTMQKISFWKYKTFLRYIKYVLRYFFWIIFKQLNLKGIKFQLKGKISVAGNARTRTVRHNIGFTSHTTFNNKILYKLDLVRTFTGVLGLKLWLVF